MRQAFARVEPALPAARKANAAAATARCAPSAATRALTFLIPLATATDLSVFESQPVTFLAPDAT